MITEERYSKLISRKPSSLSECIESSFWKHAGRFCNGALDSQVWDRIAVDARRWMAAPNVQPSGN